jgi:hypothetical protein
MTGGFIPDDRHDHSGRSYDEQILRMLRGTEPVHHTDQNAPR